MLTMESASEDVLAAVIARNELRKQGSAVSQAPGEFLDIFHRFLSVPAGLSPKAERQAEKARETAMAEYLTVNENLTLE